ncbi:MAG: hypothetical protein PHN45_06275 [Methylococcales bacterium]|nr:hypothetical protein [Methylococcales bacterium]
MGTEKRQRAVKKRKAIAEKLKKSQIGKSTSTNIAEPQHEHYYHKEAAAALEKAAKMLNPPISYEEAKHRFVIVHNIEITTAFWEALRADNEDIKPTGIDYCHECKEFRIYDEKHPRY